MASMQLFWTRPAALIASALVISGLSVSLTAMADQAVKASDRNLELMLYAGGGKQAHANAQKNTAIGIDLNFYRHVFTDKQTFFIGTGVTELTSNTDTHNRLVPYSIYPQLNLALPKIDNTQPYFYVRTLGPTYISETQLGDRQQAYHFVFQSQIGLGTYFGEGHRWQANLSYRHYSNAGLGEPNHGIDATLLLSIGRKL